MSYILREGKRKLQVLAPERTVVWTRSRARLPWPAGPTLQAGPRAVERAGAELLTRLDLVGPAESDAQVHQMPAGPAEDVLAAHCFVRGLVVGMGEGEGFGCEDWGEEGGGMEEVGEREEVRLSEPEKSQPEDGQDHVDEERRKAASIEDKLADQNEDEVMDDDDRNYSDSDDTDVDRRSYRPRGKGPKAKENNNDPLEQTQHYFLSEMGKEFTFRGLRIRRRIR
ncbi:hypothetical protein MMC17_004620 [Xylographa soralifera]|nr:hypothetical protein [Xylographa soralifera]